jgi:SpoVK/Ycf46/Vps4 family AAA+-type ATPase
MGFRTEAAPRASDRPDLADEAFREAARLTARMLPALPSNRELLDHIRRHGLQRI